MERELIIEEILTGINGIVQSILWRLKPQYDVTKDTTTKLANALAEIEIYKKELEQLKAAPISDDEEEDYPDIQEEK